MADYQRWTPSAVECYKRGGVCRGCIYEHFFAAGFKCQMKASVLCLVKNVGKPPETLSPGAYIDDDEY